MNAIPLKDLWIAPLDSWLEAQSLELKASVQEYHQSFQLLCNVLILIWLHKSGKVEDWVQDSKHTYISSSPLQITTVLAANHICEDEKKMYDWHAKDFIK
jgi:hypothetical protein